ncbi:related to ULS1-ubiquitin ligase for SUMO conjugates [Sporisorium reilianum f. sp. reilianum]|uniref:Related to ULS1-ubiquitin ligase for SUMO conjugates n=1 Tax=Sporisorium reilianum f. sp. reilianum TaxID=72559 RepID=A0A2N8UNT4_9BASI|nr:related to ULS1-ubiquitin ligase for SUMO conjugates [Sporisorium reilianum f. sp. reilianum]
MEAMRRKIMEEQLAAMEQARREQEQQLGTSAASSSSAAISSLPHRNKHAPPPKVKLYQPPLAPYIPPGTTQPIGNSSAPNRGTGSRTDPIVFGESSPIGAASRSNPFQTATNTRPILPRPPPPPPSSSTSSYAASQPFRSPNSKSSQAPFISPKSTPPLQNNNPFYHSPLASQRSSPSKSRYNASQSLFMGDDYEPAGAPARTTFADDSAMGPTVDAATRDKQIQDLLSNMVNVTEVSDDAKTSAHIPGLKCMLLPHQVQGVTWMRKREKGRAKGGILADDMGLGKTVQTLALIVSNRPGQDLSTIDLDVPTEDERGKRGKKTTVAATAPPTLAELPRKEMASKTTLIIAPLAVIKQWEREVSEKTQAGLKVYLYHGPSRAKKASHFTKFDIVITTYTTVASEYGNYLSKLEGLANGTVPLAAASATSKSKPKPKPTSKKVTSRSKARTSRADSDAESGAENDPIEIDSQDSDDSFASPTSAAKVTKKIMPTPLFEAPWLRIVLDEAQNIKNPKAKCSRACFLLAANAASRWCLTGTPLQNDAYEMFSLIHFLRVQPFDDFAHFKEKIGEPLKSNNQNRVNWGMKRLCFVLQTIMLRRTKEAKSDDGKPILNLPKRNLELLELDFDSPQEKDFYLGLQERIRQAFEKEDERQRATGKKTNMIASLVLLLRLRQACSHPAMVTGSLRMDAGAIGSASTSTTNGASQSSQQGSTAAAAAAAEEEDDDDDGLAAMLSGLSVRTKRCDQCNVEMPANAAAPSADTPNQPGDLMAAVNPDLAHRLLCVECTALANNHSQDLFASSFASTKIRKMLSLLSKIRAADPTEKTIVFSQFTSFLNLVEPQLTRHHFKYVRYDGSMKPQDRESALERIRTDPAITVILISFKAGSTGLNLTSCSRVILMDLWWNPQIEEQAFDRAHRLGQTRDVTIYKLSIKDTVEERILKLQEKKRALAKAALEGSKLVKGNRLDFKEIWFLFNGTDQ